MDSQSSQIDWTRIHRIMILNFITTTVGDSLYLLPIVHRLRRHAPQAEIILTGSPTTKAIIGQVDALNEYIELPELELIGKRSSRWKKVLLFLKVFTRTLQKVAQRKPDVCFVFLPNFAPYQLIPFLARVPYRAGFIYPGSIFSFMLSTTTLFRNPETTGDVDVHFSQANLELLKSAGIPINPDDWILVRAVTPEEHTESEKVLKQHGLHHPLVAFQIGAKYKNRQWPPERFAEVGCELAKKVGASIALIGSPAERDICEQVRKKIGVHCANLAGQLSFGVLAGLLNHCDLVLGNDSGLMHLAAGSGAQTVVLFGSPHPNHSRPLGRKKAVIITPDSWNPKALFENEPRDVVSKYLLDIDTKTVSRICLETLAGHPPKNRWSS